MPWHTHKYPDEGPVHVWPDHDVIDHDLNSDECICGPLVEYYTHDNLPDDVVIIHYCLMKEDADAAGA